MFIKNTQSKLQHEALREVAFVRCQFNLKHYSDTLFEEYGIAFPPGLARAVPKRRAEFLAGRYCAKQALAKLGFAHSNVEIGENRSPVWPQGSVGSISHDNDNAVATVKPKVVHSDSIGVDIEKWVAESEIQNLQNMIVKNEELQLLHYSSLSEQQAITTIFSAKECFFKTVYRQVGDYFDFEEARLAEIRSNSAGGELTLSVSNYLKSRLTYRHKYQIFYFLEPDSVLTVCNI